MTIARLNMTPRLLVVTVMNELAIVQYTNRPLFPYQENLARHNFQWCEKHRSCVYIFEKSDGTHVPPYWEKILAVRKHMKAAQHVLFLDLDVCIQKNPVSLFTQNCTLMYASDPQLQKRHWKPSKFNAGSWIVKNSKPGMKLMDQWSRLYYKRHAKRWALVNGSWHCHKCKWSGSAYEQGSFVRSFIKRQDVCKVHSDYLQNINVSDKLAYTKHFMYDLKYKLLYDHPCGSNT